MKNTQPILDKSTRYRVELRGQVDLDWLKSFAENVEVISIETAQQDDITVLIVKDDQSGIVGLLRRLHGMGITILNVKIVLENDTY